MSLPADPIRWFSEYLRLTGVAHTGPETRGDPGLLGKRLGLLNGSSWITLWANYFGRLFLPGVHLVNVGNEAVQINFMEAHERHAPTPPQPNIDAFVRYARDLVGTRPRRCDPDHLLDDEPRRTRRSRRPCGLWHVPVIQIDRPMMERAVRHGGRTLVIATHGPTVDSTQALLQETAAESGAAIAFEGMTVEDAWHRLAEGDVQGHNDLIARAIQAQQAAGRIDSVVLAQLSMTVLLLSHPDPVAEFGIPVFTSGQCGFERVAEVLRHG